MKPEFFLRRAGLQRITTPAVNVPDAASWDEASTTYLCTGDPQDLGGFEVDDDFPGVTGFVVKALEPAPLVEGLYQLTVRGNGVRKARQSERILPTAQVQTVADLLIGGLTGPGSGGSWPSVDVYLPGIGFEVVYVGATAAAVLTAVSKLSTAVQTALQIPGFKTVTLPKAPPNPWTAVATPKLMYPFGWVVVRAEGVALKSGVDSPHILTVGYQHRWKITPG